MRILVFAWTALIVASGGPAAAQALPGLVSGLGDRLVLAGPTSLFEGPLPRGPVTVSAALPEWLDALAYAPDGRLLAVQLSATDVPAIRLFEVGEEGGLNLLGTIDPFIHEVPLDLAFDRSGRLYYLSSYTWWNPAGATC